MVVLLTERCFCGVGNGAEEETGMNPTIEQELTEAELQAQIDKLEAEVKEKEAKTEESRKKKEAELIEKYGPGTRFNRKIIPGSFAFDEVANKWYVLQECSVCGVPEKTYTSDLFQKSMCKEHAKEARGARRKGKVSEAKKTAIDLAATKAQLAAMKAKLNGSAPTEEE